MTRGTTALVMGAVMTVSAVVQALTQRPPAPEAALGFALVGPGIWKATVGKPQDLTLLTAAAATPRTDALRRMPGATFPAAAQGIHGRLANGKVALRFPLALDEEVYGLGVDFRSMLRTGSAFQLHVDHWGGRPGRTHAPVPFYVSTKGYGVFIDSARYVSLNVGVAYHKE